MSLEEIIKTLREHMNALKRKYGVQRIAIFGSRVRGDASDSSDVDILVELDENASLLTLVDLSEELERLLNIRVDLVTPAMIDKPILKESIEEDLIYVD